MKVSDLHQHPHQLFTAQAEEPLDEAADRMHWHQVGALPVFEGQHLVGIITERDLTAASPRVRTRRRPPSRST
jgi:CBS domain-containing protein